MKTLKSFVAGKWTDGVGKSITLLNPTTEEPIAETAAGGNIDFATALAHARQTGGVALREMTFAQRGEICKALSKLIQSHRDELIGLAIQNGGNTRGDAKFDIDGASGTLFAYGEVGVSLGENKLIVDGESTQLTRSVRFFGQHIFTPREGVAVHINAFNFPAWNFCEKMACALTAGAPVIEKPATATTLVAHRIVELMVESKILPEGALTLIVGSTGDLLDRLNSQDSLAFTGSSDTAAMLRANKNLIAQNVRINLETDSLNVAMLGADVEPGSEAWNMFVADVARDMTQKTGQKCTAIRRVMVSSDQLDRVKEDLVERLSIIKVGDPSREEVTMGPLATAQQLKDVRDGIARLAGESTAIFGGGGTIDPIGGTKGKGFFVSPVLFQTRDAKSAQAVHAHEVFGPVATLIPYAGAADAIAQVRKGGGGLVASVYSDDRQFLGEVALGIAPWNGRLLLGSSKISGHAVGPGTVLPQLIHGGPGRAGGGEELGAARGLNFYLQRTAIAGDKPILEALFKKS